MTETLGQRIKRLRLRLGESQPEFGARFGVEQPTVSRWEKDSSFPVRSLHEAIAELAGMSVAQFFYPGHHPLNVPVVGYVSGSDSFTPIADADHGNGMDSLDLALEDGDFIAVRVRGDSMAPVYRDGDTIVARRLGRHDLPSATGKDCIVMTVDGHGYIKRLLAGPGKGVFRLRSYNAAYDDIEARVDWAAPIVIIKRAAL